MVILLHSFRNGGITEGLEQQRYGMVSANDL